MSMLSAQVDELRAMAESVGLVMPQAATMMMDAADIIEGLETENAKLRERGAKTLEVGKRWMAKAARFESENTKLRELVQGLWFAAQYLGMNPDGATGSGFARQMRELGVEVDE